MLRRKTVLLHALAVKFYKKLLYNGEMRREGEIRYKRSRFFKHQFPDQVVDEHALPLRYRR